MKVNGRVSSVVAVAFALLFLGAGTGLATSYTWVGTTSNAWELGGNWGAAAFPNAAGDQAVINSTTNNLPVKISTSVQLGTAAPCLTIGDSAAPTGLDIAAGGTLLFTSTSGSISNNKIITIEGTLSTTTAGATNRHYSVGGTGSISLLGGTISASGTRGYWDLNQAVSGYGTISGRVWGFSTITANNATPITISGTLFTLQGGTMATTGAGTFLNSGTISGYGTIGGTVTQNSAITASTSGQIMLITGNIVGNNTTGGFGGGSTMTSSSGCEMDFNGATLSNHYLTGGGTWKMTGDTTFTGAIGFSGNNQFLVNGFKLKLGAGNTAGTGASVILANDINVGSGTVDNTVAGNATVGPGHYFYLAGGLIKSSGGGAFVMNGGISGYGQVTAPVTNNYDYTAVGGTLFADGAINNTGHTVHTGNGANDILDIRTTVTGGFIYPGFTGGKVYLDGATIVGPASVGSSAFPGGQVVVTNDSILSGTIDSYAALTINATKKLSMSGATLNLQAGSSFTNNGTLAVGNGTLNNATAANYHIVGPGLITLAGGAITSTGGGGITSDPIVGYGTISAPYTNDGKVIADGSGVDRTLLMTGAITATTNTGGMGWYAQNHGKLTLPPLAVGSSGVPYNWGGDPTVQGMVNSVQLLFHGPMDPGQMAISLLSPDRTDVPPGLIDPIGIWAFEPSESLDFDTVDMIFRYDDAAAANAGLTADQLGLYHYQNGSWLAVSGITVDTINDLLKVNGVTGFSDYAIARMPVVTVPEPLTLTGACMAVGVLAGYIRRRTRKAGAAD